MALNHRVWDVFKHDPSLGLEKVMFHLKVENLPEDVEVLVGQQEFVWLPMLDPVVYGSKEEWVDLLVKRLKKNGHAMIPAQMSAAGTTIFLAYEGERDDEA